MESQMKKQLEKAAKAAKKAKQAEKEKEAAQKEIDEDKRKRLEMQADMGKFLLLLGFGMLYYFWVSYDVVPPIIDRAAQLLGFARFARVGDLKAMFSGGQEL